MGFPPTGPKNGRLRHGSSAHHRWDSGSPSPDSGLCGCKGGPAMCVTGSSFPSSLSLSEVERAGKRVPSKVQFSQRSNTLETKKKALYIYIYILRLRQAAPFFFVRLCFFPTIGERECSGKPLGDRRVNVATSKGEDGVRKTSGAEETTERGCRLSAGGEVCRKTDITCARRVCTDSTSARRHERGTRRETEGEEAGRTSRRASGIRKSPVVFRTQGASFSRTPALTLQPASCRPFVHDIGEQGGDDARHAVNTQCFNAPTRPACHMCVMHQRPTCWICTSVCLCQGNEEAFRKSRCSAPGSGASGESKAHSPVGGGSRTRQRCRRRAPGA